MKERIQKILSAHGVMSRRAAEKLILEGRITVNGTTAMLGQLADDAEDIIAVDGRDIPPKTTPLVLMLNKPRGYITSAADDRGRKTVLDLLHHVPCRVYPVGRLDYYSEGLLLLTNDGQFAYQLTHPKHHISKTYQVAVKGNAAESVSRLRQPMEIDQYTTHPATVSLLAQNDENSVLKITIFEGRNRQIRKMCEQCGLRVLRLKRIQIGPLALGSLRPGQWRLLTQDEQKALSDACQQK